MTTLATTRMSAKGRVVIPVDIRKALGLEVGARFVVMGDRDTVVLKRIGVPAKSELRAMLTRIRAQARHRCGGGGPAPRERRIRSTRSRGRAAWEVRSKMGSPGERRHLRWRAERARVIRKQDIPGRAAAWALRPEVVEKDYTYPDDLLAEKTRALHDRARPRDLYDVVHFLDHRPNAFDLEPVAAAEIPGVSPFGRRSNGRRGRRGLGSPAVMEASGRTDDGLVIGVGMAGLTAAEVVRTGAP